MAPCYYPTYYLNYLRTCLGRVDLNEFLVLLGASKDAPEPADPACPAAGGRSGPRSASAPSLPSCRGV